MSHWIVVGVPENRRVAMFQEALAAEGEPTARVVSWLDLARGDAEAIFAALADDGEPAFVRIDSFGESFAIDQELLRRGFDPDASEWTATPDEVAERTEDRGRIFAPRQHHRGFLAVLAELEAALARRPWLTAWPAPASIARLFDKRICAASFSALGVPVPRALPVVESPEELRAAMTEHPRVFVKLTCGSSASCLALYDRSGWLFTSMEIAGDRLYNSLRPRRYTDRAAIDRLLGFLLREGSHVEEAVPKARLGGATGRRDWWDTRMLVVGGEVAFTIVRKSVHPITNLHLGGVRGTLAETGLAPEVLAAAEASCRTIFASERCLHLGVDVMFTAERREHRVLEANAFGDLLPNLLLRGRSVQAHEIATVLNNIQ